MLKRIAQLGWVIAAAITLAACASQPTGAVAPSKTPEVMMTKSSEAMTDTMMAATPDAMMEKTPDTMMAATPDAMMAMPAWFNATLVNAANSEKFKIQDFKGKVVLIETMAMWCPTCLQQQKQLKALRDQLGTREDFVSVGLDVDINENLAGLKDYTVKNGFNWLYAVATPDVAREISQLYGDQFLNPPSTPMLIIDRQGAAHPLPFGLKSAADLQKALDPFLKEGM